MTALISGPTADGWHQIIKQYEFKGSMSRHGNCFDNAPIESFWGIVKNKLVYHQDYETRFEAISDIIKDIELDYNKERLAKYCFAATQGKHCARSETRV